MKHFDLLQKNNLLTGVKLASELKSSKDNLRKFITIFAYEYDLDGKYKPMSKILKSNIDNDVFFELRSYEIPIEYFENNWDVTDDDLINDIRIEDIKGMDNLENKLSEYIDDISIFKPEWNFENPL